MELILSDEQRLLNDSAEKFFARLGGVKRARDLRSSEAGLDRECLRKMADNGWLGMLVPEKQGGQELGPSELALVMQQAGRALAPEPIAPIALAAVMISESTDAAVRDGLLRALVAGEAVIVPALQEPSGEIDLSDTTMQAERRGGEWRLTGSKGFVLGAGTCDGFLVNARDTEGLVICHVPRTGSGLDIRLSSTVEGRTYGELVFRDVASSRLIARGNAASAILQRHHGLALVAAAAEMLGVMEGVIALTLDYLKTRKQFGRAIGSFQALQHRAVDNYVLIESTRSLLHQICRAGEPIPGSMASALKAVASGAALKVTKAAVQLHGAIGFTDEYDVGLYLKRAMWLSSHLGNESVHRRRYARLS
jgi:alkylation response protein AidB-like acyl-CoA dehydrogenase